jgi:hypothetical protein
MVLRSAITKIEHLANHLKIHYLSERTEEAPITMTEEFSYDFLREVPKVPEDLEERFGPGKYYRSGFEHVECIGKDVLFVFKLTRKEGVGGDSFMGVFLQE